MINIHEDRFDDYSSPENEKSLSGIVPFFMLF